MVIRIPKRIDKTALLLFMMFLYPAIGNYIWRVISIIIPISIDAFNTVVWLMVALWCLPYIVKNISAKHILVYLALIILFVVFFVFTEYRSFSGNTLFVLIISIIPAFFIGSSLRINDAIYELMYKASVFVLIVTITYAFYYTTTGRVLLQDNMDFAYKVLPATLFITAGIFIREDKKATNIILATISFVFLLAQGTRGPILCFLVFAVIMLLKKRGITKVTVFLAVCGIIGYLFVSSSLYNMALLKFSNVIEKAGFSTRIVEMLFSDNIFDGNGRVAIQDRLMNDIQDSPFSIRGPYSDRERLIGLVDDDYGVVHGDGGFAHNILLEMIYDYGILIGGVILLFVLYNMIRLIIKTEQKYVYIIATAVCLGFIHLLVSGSYLDEPYFFFLLGLFMNRGFVCQKKSKQYTLRAE